MNHFAKRAGLLAVAVALFSTILNAQYFGQNKVRYETFDWDILKTAHFDIYYYQREREAAVQVGQMAERWYARLSKLLQHELPKNQPVIIYDTHTAFRGTTVIPGYIGETTGGVTEGLRRRVVLPLAGPMAETDHVLGHELVHAFQYDVTTPRNTQGIGMGTPGAVALPLWFIEGMAEYLSVGSDDPHTAMWMRGAVATEKFPTIKDLDDPRYFPYRYGQAFWAYVAGRYGDGVVGEMLKAGGRARNADAAIRTVLKTTPEKLSKEWRQALIDQYEPILDATSSAESEGRVVVSKKKNGGELNTSPVLSPDGRHMIFFSERDLLSIDMFLMDVETGEIKRKLTDTAVDPHLDSLQFVNSSGAWSRDGSRFAFASIEEGKPALSIHDIKGGGERLIRLKEFGEVISLSWSPDGGQMVVSAIQNGFTDLFLVNLQDETVRRLTQDPFAELHPAWSPDGSTIAFVTDRFTSSVGDLAYGEYRLGLYRLSGGAVEQLEGFRTGKHINPQWSHDGNALYFISDHDGISNIYRVEVGSGDVRQVTNLRTGVTGIGALSPAFSVATGTGRLAFSAFRDGNYEIYTVDENSKLSGLPVQARWQGRLAGVLPPRKQASGAVADLLESPRTGLQPAGGFQRTDYKPKLSLDYVAPPSIGMGFSSYGTSIGGGTALYFSDLLGQHTVMTGFQTNSTSNGNFLNNISAIAGYQNQKSRWNWGFVGGQLPYVTGGYRNGLSVVDGRDAVVEESINFWQINREASAIVSYPFNRAQRLEFSGGFRSIDFDAEVETQTFDLTTGQLLAREKTDLPTPETINMGTASAALVYDTSVFGGTSPIMGRRYRLEFGGAAGNLTHTNALLDYREYVRPVPWLTLAGRVMHYGRYGGDAEDVRFQDIFLGYPALIRGYSAGSFRADECGPANAAGRCPAFDQLFGSRLGVANFEARVPVLGALGILNTPYLPPVETAAFYDAGIAWFSDDDATIFRSGGRNPVTSYGLSLRVNILGFAVGQISYVRPQDRPLKSWHWEFALIPGF
jgi:Tol biopolymer transport system component